MVRFSSIFVFVLVALFALELLDVVQTYVVIPFTGCIAAISTVFIKLFDANVIAYNKIIQNTVNGFAVSIEAGCNGVEATIILLSAIIAFPTTFKYKLAGALAGALAIQAINIVRISSLFYIGQWNYPLFEFLHLYIWPVLVVFDGVIVFFLWVKYLSYKRSQQLSYCPARDSEEQV